MGGERSWCFFHRRDVGGSKGKHGPKARCHLMGFHIYSSPVVPITDLHNLFFPPSAGAAKSGCIHPSSWLITNNKDPSTGVELTVVLRTVIAGAAPRARTRYCLAWTTVPTLYSSFKGSQNAAQLFSFSIPLVGSQRSRFPAAGETVAKGGWKGRWETKRWSWFLSPSGVLGLAP